MAKNKEDDIDKPKPSTYKRSPWMYAKKNKLSLNRYNSDKFGKWLLFFDEAEIDGHWEKISEAVQDGRLGIAAKVATAFGHIVDTGFDPAVRVICVYTKDYENMKDVMRVRKYLKSMGYTKDIRYKTDRATREGRYDDNSYLIDETKK